MEPATNDARACSRHSTIWVLAALVLSLVGVAGSLFLSLGMGLKACPLCFYQRSFMMGVFALLAVGLIEARSRTGLLSLLALPMAIAGLGIAAFHEYLVLTDVLECPPGILGIGTAPAQSLVLFACLLFALAGGLLCGRLPGERRQGPATFVAVVLGLLLAWGSVAGSPPLPPTPTAAYDPASQPLEVCRPPYRAAD